MCDGYQQFKNMSIQGAVSYPQQLLAILLILKNMQNNMGASYLQYVFIAEMDLKPLRNLRLL